MDIKKAIEWQESFKKTYKNSPNEIAKEAYEACDMAIRALKLMNTENDAEEK